MKSQLSLRLSTSPDPRYCAASASKHPRRRLSTHVVRIDGYEFHICSTCAHECESWKGANVQKLAEVA